MKVIKPTLITSAMVVSTDAPLDVSPEWISGATYSPNTSNATDQASHVNLVKKPTFADGLVGTWVSDWYGHNHDATASASSSGELRVKDRDNWEGGNSFAVTAGETIYASFDFDTSSSVDGGAFGLQVTGAGGIVVGFIGVGYEPGVAWTRRSGSMTIPAGATAATPWIQINDFPWIDPTRHYNAFDNLYLSRGLPGTNSANLVVKSTFASATFGGWTGNGGTANITAVTNSRGGDGMLTTPHRDTLELGNYFTVFPGETIHISYDVLSISCAFNGNCGLMVENENGTVIAWLGVPYQSGLAWTRMSGTITMPESAASAMPWLQIDEAHGAESSASFSNIYICRHARGAMGPFVTRRGVKKVYERITSGVSTTAPENDLVNWSEVGPTNEWAMFDREISTHTASTGSISVTIRTGYVNSISLYGLTGDMVYITVRDGLNGQIIYGNSNFTGPKEIVLDGTLITSWYEYYYEPIIPLKVIVLTDLPPYNNAHITVTVTGSSDVAIGLLDVGSFYDLGQTEYNPSITIVDYSKKTTDVFGKTIFVSRSFAKRLSAKMMFDNIKLNKIASVLASLRATPCSWSATDVNGMETLNIFGWFEDMSIVVAYPTASYCDISVQGLSE